MAFTFGKEMNKTKATVWTSIFAMTSLVVLGLLAFAGAGEGGLAAQGAIAITIGAIPTLLFSAVFFPMLAKLIEKSFTKSKWIGLNLVLIVLSGLTIEMTIGPFFGSEGGLFIVATPILAIGVSILAAVWLRIALPKTIEPNKSVDSTPVSAPR